MGPEHWYWIAMAIWASLVLLATFCGAVGVFLYRGRVRYTTIFGWTFDMNTCLLMGWICLLNAMFITGGMQMGVFAFFLSPAAVMLALLSLRSARRR